MRCIDNGMIRAAGTTRYTAVTISRNTAIARIAAVARIFTVYTYEDRWRLQTNATGICFAYENADD